jgi:hypothetical protein
MLLVVVMITMMMMTLITMAPTDLAGALDLSGACLPLLRLLLLQDELPIFVNTLRELNAVKLTLPQLLKVADLKGDGVIDIEELFVLNEKMPQVGTDRQTYVCGTVVNGCSMRRQVIGTTEKMPQVG